MKYVLTIDFMAYNTIKKTLMSIIKRGWRALLLVFLLLAVISLSQNIINLINRGLVLEREKTNLEALRKEKERLEAELNYMETNGFLEREARDDLGLVKEGEIVVILPSESGSGRDQAWQENNHTSNRAAWKQWWQLFF